MIKFTKESISNKFLKYIVWSHKQGFDQELVDLKGNI